MLRINNIRLKPGHDEKALYNAVAKQLHKDIHDIAAITIARRSLDARRHPDIFYIYSVNAELKKKKDEQAILARAAKRRGQTDITAADEAEYVFPLTQDDFTGAGYKRPVIAGFGPAGMFAGLMLARCGLKPIILERGQAVEERQKTVEEFWTSGRLDTESNVQFGEGGAGTFSDGKLNTSVKDAGHRMKEVLKTFADMGADESVTYVNKPHIGTDVLCRVVRNIREEIIRLGGEVRFNTFFENFECADGHLSSVSTRNVRTGQCERIDTDHLIIALGHSSRDTFRMLYERNIDMIPKAFAVGVRIEHPQSLIDHNAYGDTGYRLPAADYKLTHQTDKGRGVYSFCMCPGGYVVNASSEDGMTAVNGMSYSGRDSSNANSAIIVTVTPDDYRFPGHELSPLDGVEFQRNLERAAYEAGGGLVPVQLLGDFISNVESTELGSVTPNIKGCYRLANVRKVLPAFVGDSIAESIPAFARSIHGYDMADAVVSGVESRTSSPLRIIRNNDTFESNIHGIYPCGEGAGYAGGITSAAMDGIKVAEKCALSIYSKIRI